MLFLADENTDRRAVYDLRTAGYDVTYIAELAQGAGDIDILAQSLTEQRILITEDLDFCELIFRDKKPAYGIILLRILPAQRALKGHRLLHLI